MFHFILFACVLCRLCGFLSVITDAYMYVVCTSDFIIDFTLIYYKIDKLTIISSACSVYFFLFVCFLFIFLFSNSYFDKFYRIVKYRLLLNILVLSTNINSI